MDSSCPKSTVLFVLFLTISLCVFATIVYMCFNKSYAESYDSVAGDMAEAEELQQAPLPSDGNLIESGATYMQLDGIQPSTGSLPANDPFYQPPPKNWEIGVI